MRCLRWITLLLFTATFGMAQDTLHLSGFGIYEQDQVWLRWAPVDWLDWGYPSDCGFTITRWEVESDGIALIPSKWKPTEHIFPVVACHPLEHWEDLVQQDTFAGIAAVGLWGTPTTSTDPVDRVVDLENRKSIVLWAADHSFQTAQYLGLGWRDSSAMPGRLYAYRISTNCTDYQSDTLLILVPTYHAYSWPVVGDLISQAVDEGVKLQWHPFADLAYSSYQIYRSEDSLHWHSIQDANLLVMDPAGVSSGPYYFTDTSARPDQNYYYRLRGMTAFGFPGPWSNVTGCSVPPPLPDLGLRILSIVGIQGQLHISWQCREEAALELDSWQIWRTGAPGEESQLLAKQLPSSSRNYVDLLPLAANYYRLEALDHYGRSIRSNLAFYELEDSVPPPLPDKMQGWVDTFGYVHLQWTASTAPDLKGYRVYRNYRPEVPAALRTAAIRPDTMMLDSLDIHNRLDDTIYYTLRTVDFHENESEYRPFLALPVPDLIAPTPPLITGWKSISDGIRLQLISSGSDDVIRYQIERSLEGANWEIIKDYDAELLPREFADTTLNPGQKAVYRIKALDDAGLYSTSAPVQVQRLDNQIPEGVQVLQAMQSRDDSHQMDIFWQALADQPIQQAILYRAINDEPYSNFRSFPYASWQIKDGLATGTFRDILFKMPDRIRYKMILQYENGRYSDWSEEVIISP